MFFFNRDENKPVKVKLKKGETYFFCTCGLTGNEPFCDGIHAGTHYQSISLTPDRNKKVLLCTCKQSSCIPYCDGCHKNNSRRRLNKQ